MKKLLTVILTMGMILGMTNAVLSTNAAAAETGTEERIEGNERYMSICQRCGGGVWLVCMGDAHYNKTATHNSGNCTYDVYKSRSARICTSCGNLDSISEGEHYCFERHRGCSKGDYYVCPCDIR